MELEIAVQTQNRVFLACSDVSVKNPAACDAYSRDFRLFLGAHEETRHLFFGEHLR
jgi:hypothetical protein